MQVSIDVQMTLLVQDPGPEGEQHTLLMNNFKNSSWDRNEKLPFIEGISTIRESNGELY